MGQYDGCRCRWGVNSVDWGCILGEEIGVRCVLSGFFEKLSVWRGGRAGVVIIARGIWRSIRMRWRSAGVGSRMIIIVIIRVVIMIRIRVDDAVVVVRIRDVMDGVDVDVIEGVDGFLGKAAFNGCPVEGLHVVKVCFDGATGVDVLDHGSDPVRVEGFDGEGSVVLGMKGGGSACGVLHLAVQNLGTDFKSLVRAILVEPLLVVGVVLS